MKTLSTTTPVGDRPRLGIRTNLGQFLLLLAVNGLVGALVGQERTLVPLFGEQGLTWSITVVMKIDLAGPRRRGLAMAE